MVADADDFAELVAMIADGGVKPVVAATFPLADLRTAQARFKRKDFVGKIVIDCTVSARAESSRSTDQQIGIDRQTDHRSTYSTMHRFCSPLSAWRVSTQILWGRVKALAKAQHHEWQDLRLDSWRQEVQWSQP